MDNIKSTCILVLGGTTEGRLAAQVLEEAGTPFLYSTRGATQQVELHHGRRCCGPLDAEAMAALCAAEGVGLLVDAAHPFAEALHRTVDEVARRLRLPVVRWERVYPPLSASCVACENFDEAALTVASRLSDGHRRVLALTGVQTIGKLRALWEREDVDCRFRILDREESFRIAARWGFVACGDEGLPQTDGASAWVARTPMKKERVGAVVTKESGESGGFDEKVALAERLDVPLYVVQRPRLPQGWTTVTGPVGLRRAVERLLPPFFPLHSGLTTGTCATAAALAAARRVVGLPEKDEVEVCLPGGETITVGVGYGAGYAYAIKDGGDDPDVTDKAEIRAEVTIVQADTPYYICIEGGEGIGTVTLPGLDLPVGAKAINRVPQQMIRANLSSIVRRLDEGWGLRVRLSVPGGEALARRTFNSRIGIVGGISIIGTTGVVKPFSTDAFLGSIRKSIGVAVASDTERVVMNSGGKSEGILRARYPDLPPQAFVQYGNFVGEAIRMCAEAGVRRLTIGVMIGKAVKLAEGHLDTHSHKVTMNRDFVAQLLRESGCDEAVVAATRELNMARELWKLVPASRMEAFCHTVVAHCHSHLDGLLPDGELTVLLVREEE